VAVRFSIYPGSLYVKSSDLTKYGFGAWLPFSRANEPLLLPQLPTRPGAYVIRRSTPYQRRKGLSDILYFGSAANARGLKNRLSQYFHPGPTQRTNIRILNLVGGSSDFEVSVVTTDSIPDAKFLESTLLEAYEAEHGELPPENKRH
jgi:excinuclease UvrABC nuclease subunit